MNTFEIVSIDEEFEKSQVKGFTRTRKGKMERVNPFERAGEPGEFSKILSGLKNFLQKILGMKKQGTFSNEQRAYANKKLKELELKLKDFKVQKQRIAISNAFKQIRKELEEKEKTAAKRTPMFEKKTEKKEEPKKPLEMKSVLEKLDNDMVEGIKKLGYSIDDVKGMSEPEAKAIYHNDITKEESGKTEHKPNKREELENKRKEGYKKWLENKKKGKVNKPKYTSEELQRKRKEGYARWLEAKKQQQKIVKKAFGV